MRDPARPLLVVAVLLVAVGATACGTTPAGSGGRGGSSATPPSSAAPAAPGSGASPSASGSAVPDGVREHPAVVTAVEDAARRRGAPPGEVVIAALTSVTWSDGSLGCPRGGMSYTQALVDGELLVLEVGGARLQYHGRVGGPYTYCAAPSSSGG